MPERILVVEDEETLRRNLVRYLEQQGHRVDGFGAAEPALEAAAGAEYAVALVDLRLPGKDGITLAAELAERSPETAVLLMTAYGSVESAVEALRAGVQDYLLKPILLRDAGRKVAQACEHRRLLRENAKLRRQLAERCAPPSVVARSRAMADIVAFARQIATTNRTVLIEGESGSGKEVIAHLIHDASSRREGPFVPVSMTAIAESLLESCLFGHERGAFPGADARREGLFRAASSGTLFLDDIGELPLSQQAKLLRAIETKEVLPVGSDRPVRADVRIVVASKLDLAALVAEKRFREDLYFRLSALKIEVPPLRKHPEDIPPLAELFLLKHTKEHTRPITGFDGAAMRRLLAYAWPGNVRELSNVIERATIACGGSTISVADLPAEIAGAAAGEEGGHQEAMATFERALIRSTLERAGRSPRGRARPRPVAGDALSSPGKVGAQRRWRRPSRVAS
ncbi:MAG: sigma-54 dependent transcriptional regulator [Byssovorax sp.]